MKGLLIALGIGAGVTAAYVAKKINDDRQDMIIKSEGNVDYFTKETFKQAAKRKVNEILAWISENTEKVESIVKTVSVVSTAIGICTAALELYSAAKRTVKDPDEELLKEVEEIKVRLIHMSPDIEVGHF